MMDQEKDTSGPEKEIAELRSQLDSVNKKKEEAFKNKEDLKKQLSELIKKVKGVGAEKKKEGTGINSLKKQRDQHNNNVKTLITEIKALNSEKSKFPGKDTASKDFMHLKKEIEILEFKVEHEALSPSDEKKVMKKIKELKKYYDSAGESIAVIERINELSRKIEEEKKLADNFHNQLVEAQKGTMSFGALREVSKEIMAMRSKQEAEFANFIKLKQEFKELSEKLKQKLVQSGYKPKQEKHHDKKPHPHSQYNRKKQQNPRQHVHQEVDSRKKQEQAKILQEKTKEVEEKLRTRKKLTTEDLLILQQKTD